MNEKNTLNFTFNFNAPVGQNIAHVDRLEAHFDKDMTMQVVDTATLAREEAKSSSAAAPSTARATRSSSPWPVTSATSATMTPSG